MNMVRHRSFAANTVECTKLVTLILQVWDGDDWSTLRSLPPEEGKLSTRRRSLELQERRWKLINYFGDAEFRIIEAPYLPPMLRI